MHLKAPLEAVLAQTLSVETAHDAPMGRFPMTQKRKSTGVHVPVTLAMTMAILKVRSDYIPYRVPLRCVVAVVDGPGSVNHLNGASDGGCIIVSRSFV